MIWEVKTGRCSDNDEACVFFFKHLGREENWRFSTSGVIEVGSIVCLVACMHRENQMS